MCKRVGLPLILFVSGYCNIKDVKSIVDNSYISMSVQCH